MASSAQAKARTLFGPGSVAQQRAALAEVAVLRCCGCCWCRCCWYARSTGCGRLDVSDAPAHACACACACACTVSAACRVHAALPYRYQVLCPAPTPPGSRAPGTADRLPTLGPASGCADTMWPQAWGEPLLPGGAENEYVKMPPTQMQQLEALLRTRNKRDPGEPASQQANQTTQLSRLGLRTFTFVKRQGRRGRLGADVSQATRAPKRPLTTAACVRAGGGRRMRVCTHSQAHPVHQQRQRARAHDRLQVRDERLAPAPASRLWHLLLLRTCATCRAAAALRPPLLACLVLAWRSPDRARLRGRAAGRCWGRARSARCSAAAGRSTTWP